MDLLIDDDRKCTEIDAHRLMARLWQGSVPLSGALLRDLGFDVVVLCAEELQTPDDFSVAGINPPPDLVEVGVYRCPLDDARLTEAEASRAHSASVALARMHREGKRILVTCAQGRNRSGLVAALTMRLLLGCTGSHAASIVRMVRPRALTNHWFRDYLDGLPAPSLASRQGRGRRHAIAPLLTVGELPPAPFASGLR